MSHRISVHVIRATDLKREDGLLGKNDPYIVLSIGHLLNKQKFKTKTHKNQAGTVEFNEEFEFKADASDKLKVKVYDDDLVSDDDIGETEIKLDTLFQHGQDKQAFAIGEGSKIRGRVELHLKVIA
ncbi:hypothetical protein BGZ96_011603 [Linnemannia gamsii]|uniref:C2 domain-containing protein n=1 Tax=Linnemannia gamsii TaxID=64522 RepID=A0ABQ7JSK8_9FUNG|nr:hypothetical protein BGZ96_011603 [Linnemannia gamsii]